MAPFYRYLTTELPSFFPLNKNLLDSCVKSNEAELKALADKLEDARQNLGETEITETLLKQAEFYARIGDKVCFYLFARNLRYFSAIKST